MASTGLDWLTWVMPDPAAFRAQWERTGLGLMPLPAGRRWDVLSVPGQLGYLALEIMDAGPCGPVLADFDEDLVRFLVPVGTAARWVGTGVRGSGEGTWIVVPHPGRVRRPVRWLVPPDGSGRLTDPVLLELALHEAAAGLSDW